MKRFPALILILIILAGLLRPVFVLAQGDPTVLLFEFEGSGSGSYQGWFYSAEFDQEGNSYPEDIFDLGNGGAFCVTWCIGAGGWNANENLTAVYGLGDDVEIQEIRFRMKNNAEGLSRYYRVRVYNAAMEIVYNEQHAISAAAEQTYEFDLTAEEDPVIGRYVVIHVVTQWSIAIDWVEITATLPEKEDKTYVYPLSAGQYTANLHTWDSANDMLNLTDAPVGPNFEMLAYASQGLQLVHSPTSGVVTDIQPLAACTYEKSASAPTIAGAAVAILASANPLVGIVAGAVQYADMINWQAAGDGIFCAVRPLLWNNIDLLNELDINYYYIPQTGDIVTIQSSQTGDYISYLVMDSEYFVEVGTPVAAGCVIGMTIPIWYGQFFDSPQSYSENGYGAIWAVDMDDNPIDIFERYYRYPESNTPCNASTFDACLNENPSFNYYGLADWGWAFDGSADRNPSGNISGLLLDDSGANNASQMLMLNTENQYSIKIVAHVEHPNDTFTDSDIVVSLGTTDHTITLPYGGDETENVIPLQTYESDLAGGVYTLRVALAAGETGAEVVISYLCVDDDADPITPLPSCLFVNSGFDENSDWTLTGATISDGALLLPTSATQALDLAVDSYALEVRARGSADGVQTITISGSGAGGLFGNAGGVHYWQSQSFTTGSAGQIAEVTVAHNANTGSPTGTATMEVRSNSGGSPGSVLWSGTYTPTTGSNTITIAGGPALSGSTLYWLVFRPTSPQAADTGWNLAVSPTSTYAGGSRAYSANSGSTWTSDTAEIGAVIEINNTADLSWSVDGGSLADGTVAIGENWSIYTSDPFTISSPASAVDFEISSGASIDVDYVCLIPDSQPTAPPVADYPDVRDCNSCPIRLTGESPHDIVESIQWHDCRARQIYYCDFRKLMVDTRDGVYEAVRGVGMLGRWLAASGSKQLIWFRSAFWYLGGLLNNVALAIQDSIAWSGGANTVIISDTPLGILDVLGMLITGLRDVLVTTIESLVELVGMLLGFLTPIVGTLLDVITSALAMLTEFISSILDQVGIVHTMIAAIIDGANNASPATIAGAPDCAASPEGLCWGFYILDNTVFSGPVADLLPLLAGAATLNLLVWVLGKFRDAFASLS